MILVVVHTVGLVTLQDRGRFGLRKFGVPPSGPFDRASFRRCNDMLGNSPWAPVLELSMAELRVRARTDGALSFSGARCQVWSGEHSIVPAGVVEVMEGEEVRVCPPDVGARVYIGIPGGFRGRLVAGSCSGWSPKPGDLLESDESNIGGRAIGPTSSETCGESMEILIHPGPQAGSFDQGVITSGKYRVTRFLDRTGIRLDGPNLGTSPEIVSEPAFPGSVQVARNGQPIIIGPDGPTIGGYSKIAQVAERDFDRLGQLRPGNEVRFVWAG